VRDIAIQLKKCALNTDLKDLYNKTIPHVATMEAIGKEMTAEVDRLEKIVEQYDVNLSVKANKQELMAVDNKFRQYVKKVKY
jgi:hypothetical protein